MPSIGRWWYLPVHTVQATRLQNQGTFLLSYCFTKKKEKKKERKLSGFYTLMASFLLSTQVINLPLQYSNQNLVAK